MKKRILSFCLAVLMVFGMLPVSNIFASGSGDAVSVWYFNPATESMEKATDVVLYRGGDIYLSADLRSGVSGRIQWQIEAGDDRWVDIQGGIGENLRVSYGMVKSLLRDSEVRMRCTVSGEGETLSSDSFKVIVSDADNRMTSGTFNMQRAPVAPDPLPAPVGVPNAPTEPVETEPTEPVETEPSEPMETEPTEPVETEPTEPVETEPTEPVETKPTEPMETEATEPVETKPTEPVETKPTEPVETEPAATQPAPAETEPIKAVETEPAAPAAEQEITAAPTESAGFASTTLAAVPAKTNRKLSAVSPRLSAAGREDPGEDLIVYTVTIEYVYAADSQFAGQRVALPYIADVAKGVTLEETVFSPTCVGYQADIASIDLSTLGAIEGNISRTVEYSPDEVSYTVRHYQQNVDNDEYVWVDTTMATGKTEALTSDSAALTYTGFTALSHYREEIAADSSTAIDIYYDRNYYLMSFELDGGYGVRPVYARYGASITVGTPSKAGYVFTGWMDANGQIVAVPSKMPSEKRTFTAHWTPQAGIGYRVTYWIINEDNSKTLLGSHIEYGTSGSLVDGSDNLGTQYGTICGEELSHVHSTECYNCNIPAHGHTDECFATFKRDPNDPGENGIAAIEAAGKESGYIYVIYSHQHKQYWPKLYMNGQYYVVNDTQGGTTTESFSSIVEGEPLVTKTGTYGTEQLTVTKYQAKSDCGSAQHVHIASCDQNCTVHTHEEKCYYNTRHLEFIEADQDVVIRGDGSSIVNVYYRNKEYTLRFYYAASTGTGDNITYKIVGGSTYYFGQNNGTDSSDDEDVLERQWSISDQWGTVDELPTLNARGAARNYTMGTEVYTYNNTDVTYYYISFKARFGDNIAEKWPTGVFNSVTRTDKNNANGWSGTEAFVSAWNGEHHVKYSQDKKNETIKGVYEKLDENLLFAPKYEDETTVSYLCFWENGANIHWSIPELYHYNIYIAAYSGQTFDEDTVTVQKNGATYYLVDSYDTCDNSSVGEQTQVSLLGYDPIFFDTAIDGYEINNDGEKFEFRRLTGTSDETLLQQPGYYDSRLYNEGFEINFYYSAKKYKLSFWNLDRYLTDGTGSEVTYKEPLYKYFEGITVNGVEYEGANDLIAKPQYYPLALEEGVYVFDGWYSSANFESETKIDPTVTSMPDSALMVYARWVPISRQVNMYLTAEGASNDTHHVALPLTVPNGSIVPEDQRPDPSTLTHPEDENATFVGWFYKDARGMELAFDFANMAITQDMHIYAKWRSNIVKQVDIRYVILDDNNQEILVADTESYILRMGQTRTFEAKTGMDLYEDYRIRCFPTASSHSITPVASDFGNDDPIVWTFVYKQYNRIPYQVQFVVKEKDGTERPAFRVDENGKAVFMETYDQSAPVYVELHTQNDKAVVTEHYKPDDLADTSWVLPGAFLPNALRQQLVVVPALNADGGFDETATLEKNIIKFVYTYTESVDPDKPVFESMYMVQHFIQDPETPENYEESNYFEHQSLSGETVSATPITIPGYVYSYEVTNEKMAAYNGNRTDKNTIAEDRRTMSGVVTADNTLELNFYYTPISYPYQVMYLEEGTNRVLAPAKTTDENGNKLQGLFGAKVSAEALEIEGYDVDATNKSIYIHMEAGDTASVNTIVFYYVKQRADLVITKTLQLDEEQAKHEGFVGMPDFVKTQEFEFIVGAKKGFLASVYDYTVYDSEGREVRTGVVTTKDTFVLNPIAITGGQRIQLHGLPLGEYTVTESYTVGFRTTVAGIVTPATAVVLDTTNETVQVEFVNTFPFYTGDLVIEKYGTDAIAAGNTFKIKVTLQPADATREIDRTVRWTNGDGTEQSLVIPKLSTDSSRTFEIVVDVPMMGKVTLLDAPAGTFTAEEIAAGTDADITDYYDVYSRAAIHASDNTQFAKTVFVQSQIHGGHPTTVGFYNAPKFGSIEIQKTVTQEYVNDSWQSDAFEFEIQGTTELPDGDYAVDGATVHVENGIVTVKDAEGNNPVISIARTDEADSWIGSLTFTQLPAGKYTVKEILTESQQEQYLVEPEEKEITLLANDAATVKTFAFTNTFKRTAGNLQVGKEIVIVSQGSLIDREQKFTFEVHPKDAVLGESYACVIKSTMGTETPDDDEVVPESATSLPVVDGYLSFELKHNQYILIQNMPVGEYLVKELAVEGYDSSFGDVATDAGRYSVDPATITTGQTTVLKCQNAYPVYYSNLIVKKTVVTPADHSAIDQAPTDDRFTFRIRFWDYSSMIDLSNGISAKFYDSPEDTTPTEGSLIVSQDVLTFTLTHGQWVDLNLPACAYKIEEVGLISEVNSNELAAHYTTAYTVGGTAGADDAEHVLISGEREVVEFVNTYKRHYADLTITTKCADAEQSFIFDVTATDTARGPISLQVVLVGNDSQTIKDLPIGTYTVTEKTKWSWRESDVNSQSVELRDASVTVPFEFGAVDRIFWLSGYGYNIRKKGGG